MAKERKRLINEDMVQEVKFQHSILVLQFLTISHSRPAAGNNAWEGWSV